MAPAAPTALHVSLKVSPKEARLVLDGNPISNPYSGVLAPDGKPHVLKVTAEGYLPKEEIIVLERDLSIDIALEREAVRPPEAKPSGPPPTNKPAVVRERPKEPTALPSTPPTPSEAPPARVHKPKRPIDLDDPYGR